MSAFGDALQKFNVTAESRVMDTFVNSTEEVQRSVVEGSEITGSPGIPVDTSNLRDSFVPEFTSNTTWETTTNVHYAKHVEDNVRGVTFKNHGPHFVKTTVAGWDRIVDHAAKKAAGDG